MAHSEPITGPYFMRDLANLLNTREFQLNWRWDGERESYLGEIQRGTGVSQIMIPALQIEEAISWETVHSTILEQTIEVFTKYSEPT